MKRALFFIPFAVLTFLGCKKNDPVVTPLPVYAHGQPYSGIATAFKNGEPWIAHVYGVNRPSDSAGTADRFLLYLDHYEKNGVDSFLSDYLYIDYLQYEVYKTDLAGDSVFTQPPSGVETIRHIKHLGSDVIEPPSTLLKSGPHWVEIISYSPSTFEVSGKFESTFVSFDNKDTLRFTGGFFTAKIYQ